MLHRGLNEIVLCCFFTVNVQLFSEALGFAFPNRGNIYEASSFDPYMDWSTEQAPNVLGYVQVTT